MGWNDYKKMVEGYRKSYGLDESDRRLQALRATYQLLWAELLRHAPGGGRRS